MKEFDQLTQVLKELNVSYHSLKTRKAGHYRFVEFHLEMEGEMKLENVHKFCDRIEERLQQEFKKSRLVFTLNLFKWTRRNFQAPTISFYTSTDFRR
jgi:divalent metal cation (Fe/Co/Zn/Cd) transporter